MYTVWSSSIALVINTHSMARWNIHAIARLPGIWTITSGKDCFRTMTFHNRLSKQKSILGKTRPAYPYDWLSPVQLVELSVKIFRLILTLQNL